MTKRYFLLGCIALLAAISSCLNKGTQRGQTLVAFRVVQKTAYCGGARPSEEILNDLELLRPLAETQFYIKKGSVNDPSAPAVYSSITDDEGLAFVSLAPGDYMVIFEEKQDWTTYNKWKLEYNTANDPYAAIDTLCLRDWLVTPDAVFTVKSDSMVSVDVIQYARCFWNEIPCLDYLGPIPR